MYRDDVTCTNCGTRSTVELGADACPLCGMVGSLRWTDDDRQGVETVDEHGPHDAAGMDWHIDTRGKACACIEEEHDERPRISYAQATALDEWDRKTERTG